jgi:arsenate reductase-like glutaredoxin family protein
LNDIRLEHLQKMKIIYQLIQVAVEDLDNQELQKLAQQAKENLEHAVSDQGEFAAAMRASLNDGFDFILP